MPPKPRVRRRRGRSGAGRKGVRRKSTPRSEGEATVDQLLQKVEECLDVFQYELALAHCEKALQLEPQSLPVLETAGPLLLEAGQTDRALECFQATVALSPDEGHSKYMYLGQLYSGQEAVQYFAKGIEIMTRELEAGQGGGGRDGASKESWCVTKDDISSAYCAMAEIYLTDSCLTPEAERHCHECCSKAVEWSPSSPEAYQALASCLLSMDQREEAKAMLLKGISLWLPKEGEERIADIPPHPSRIAGAKLLLELGELQRAFTLLEGLLCEDDEVVGVWYLMGWLHVLWKDRDSAIFYLQQTEKLFSKLECDEVDILEHTRELLQELMEEGGEWEGQEGEGQGDTDEDSAEEDTDICDGMDIS